MFHDAFTFYPKKQMIFDQKQQQTNNFKVLLFIESLNKNPPKNNYFWLSRFESVLKLLCE